MSFSARYVPAALLTILSLAATLCAQSTTKKTTKAPRGTISGRVTIKDKGAPGVAVSLRSRELITPFQSYLSATTDQDGVYRITNVPAGTYEIAPLAPAFVVTNNNNSPTKSVVVSEDENVEGINFSLVRGGVITGKVVDSDGRPIIQQQVHVFRTELFERQTPQRQIFPTSSAQTDDRGIYRMYGLSAGRYKVGTGLSDDNFVGMNNPRRATYKQVFHPDVADHTKATIIDVSEGSEARDVDIKLAPALETFSVSGRVVDGENSAPVPNARFGIQRQVGDRSDFVNSVMLTNERGEFSTEGLIPGKYGIYLFPLPNSEMRADSVGFEIVDQDVSGVIIKLVKGASLSGVVVLESEDKTVHQKLPQMQLRAYVMPPGGGTGFGQSPASSIALDGSFRLAALPAGTANIYLTGVMGPMNVKGLMISRVERDGVVMPRGGIEIKENEQVTGLRVFVTYGNASIRGVVKLENGSPPAPGTGIFVRVTKMGEMPTGIRPPQVDARGHFLMDGLPPGTYELNVTMMGTKGSPPNNVKREVTLQDGVVTDVVITFEATKPPNP